MNNIKTEDPIPFGEAETERAAPLIPGIINSLTEKQVIMDVLDTEVDGHRTAYVIMTEYDPLGPFLKQVGILELSLDYDETAFANNLYIAPDYRGHGYGQALMVKAQSWARAKGFNYFWFAANTLKESLIDYYKDAGFIPVGEYKSGSETYLAFMPPPEVKGLCEIHALRAKLNKLSGHDVRQFLCYAPSHRLYNADNGKGYYNLCQKHYEEMTDPERE